MVKFSLILSLLSLQHAIKISSNNNNLSSLTCGFGLKKIKKVCKKIFGDGYLKNWSNKNEINNDENILSCKTEEICDQSCSADEATCPVQMEQSCSADYAKCPMEDDKVNKRVEKLREKMDPLLEKFDFKKGAKNLMHVYGRATASRRSRLTGEHLNGPEWIELVSAVKQYFNGTNTQEQTKVQISSQFNGMIIMPIENEGKFALKAITTLATSGTNDLSTKINEKAIAKKLISMEQGGRSMQIWSGQEKTGKIYPDQTGLYDNLGNNAIKEKLQENANTTCLIPVKPKNGGSVPKSNFSVESCRQELKKLEKKRSLSDKKGQWPTLVKDGLYVAFSSFYWPAKNLGLNGKIMNFSQALRKVNETVDSTTEFAKICPEKHEAVDYNDRHNDAKCMQILMLQMMLKEMMAESNGIDPEIVFTNQINKKDVSWTIGLADMMKEQVQNNGDHIVVMDLGSSSTKVFAMQKIDKDNWSEMAHWGTIAEGDLLEVTAP